MFKGIVLGGVGILAFFLWAFAQPCLIETFFSSPEVGDNAEAVVLHDIDTARENLDIAASSITTERFSNAILRAEERGVSVRIILPDGVGDHVSSHVETLLTAGVLVRCVDGLAAFTHEFLIIDDRIVLVGFQGWMADLNPPPYSSLIRVRCASVNAALLPGAYQEEFDRLWKGSNRDALLGMSMQPERASISILSVDQAAQCIYLLNSGANAVDITGWSLNDLEGTYTFPDGTAIPPNDPYRICGALFNPTEDVGGLYLELPHDEVFVATPEGEIVDEYVW